MTNLSDFISSKITPDHVREINADTVAMLCDGLKAHLETSRPAKVSVHYQIKLNKETGKHELTARSVSSEPKGAANTYQRKRSPVVLVAFTDEIPGQQHIGDEP